MIARTWWGATRSEDAEPYLDYLCRTGLAAYAATDGNLGAIGLLKRSGGSAEFLLISLWESHAAIERFAGPQIERATFYPEDDGFLLQRDEHADHYEVAHLELGRLGGSRRQRAAPPALDSFSIVRLP